MRQPECQERAQYSGHRSPHHDVFPHPDRLTSAPSGVPEGDSSDYEQTREAEEKPSGGEDHNRALLPLAPAHQSRNSKGCQSCDHCEPQNPASVGGQLIARNDIQHHLFIGALLD